MRVPNSPFNSLVLCVSGRKKFLLTRRGEIYRIYDGGVSEKWVVATFNVYAAVRPRESKYAKTR